MDILVLILYTLALVFILMYSVMQIILVVSYVRFRKKRKTGELPGPPPLSEYPFVTVQLPIYNEQYVIEQLIDAVGAFDYPLDKFEIQVLDDSNDETLDIVAAKVEELKAKGIQIEQIRRPERTGFKAGALQFGLNLAKGEFIAIFDADFVPTPDFLTKTLPWFTEEKMGVVQTRWGHINENYSLLTKLQAFALNGHFTIEQKGRNAAGHFINFNGTAGVWRRECIETAGGWQADTLTEDLDLSYRAQLKGWKMYYLEEHLSPAELPAAMSAVKSQQYRWNKGAAESARKHLRNVFKADLPFWTKVHAFFHLMNSGLFISILMCAVLSVPLLGVKNNHPEWQPFFNAATIFLFSMLALIVFFWHSRSNEPETGIKKLLKFAGFFPLFLAISMGMSLHNAVAVIEGYLGHKTPFIRTPKFRIKKAGDKWADKKYLNARINPLTIVEGLLTLYFMGGIWLAFSLEDFGLLAYHILLVFGFGFVFWVTVRHSRLAA